MSNIVKAGGLKSFAGLSADDIKPTRVMIGQKNSEKGEKGHFIFNTGESVKELLEVVPLFVKKTRVLYAKGSRVPKCASDNFFTPAIRIENAQCENCMICHASYWGVDNPEKEKLAKEIKTDYEKKPLCKEQYNVYMVDKSGTPFILNVHGSSITTLQKQLFTRYQMQHLELYQASVDLKLELKKSGSFEYYGLTVSNFKPLADYSAQQKLFDMYFSRGEEILEEQFEEETAAAKAQEAAEGSQKLGIDEDEPVPF